MDAVERFRASMDIDREKWHDGIGYDLTAIDEAAPAERERIEAMLLPRAEDDWRDVEALARLCAHGSVKAEQALRHAMRSSDAQIRMAVTRHAPHLVERDERLASLVDALRHAEFYGGLTQAIDEAQDLQPPIVIDTLLRGALEREGGVAVHFAALLTYLHGKAAEPFDWEQRPFFLRFHAPLGPERDAVFRELCARIGVDPEPYLRAGPAQS